MQCCQLYLAAVLSLTAGLLAPSFILAFREPRASPHVLTRRSAKERTFSAVTVLCSSDLELASAVAIHADVALISTDITVSNLIWAQVLTIPTTVSWPLAIIGAYEEAERWPVLDLANATSLMHLVPGGSINISQVIIKNWRSSAPYFQAPGIDMFIVPAGSTASQASGLATSPPPAAASGAPVAAAIDGGDAPNRGSSPPIAAPAVLYIWKAIMIHSYCVPGTIFQKYMAELPRPPQLPPGNQTARVLYARGNFDVSIGNSSSNRSNRNGGCVNSTSVPAALQCWAARFHILDIGLTAVNVNSYGRTIPAGYLAWLYDTQAWCEVSMTDACLAANNGPLGCYNAMYRAAASAATTSAEAAGASSSGSQDQISGGSDESGSSSSRGHRSLLIPLLLGLLGGSAVAGCTAVVGVLMARAAVRSSLKSSVSQGEDLAGKATTAAAEATATSATCADGSAASVARHSGGDGGGETASSIRASSGMAAALYGTARPLCRRQEVVVLSLAAADLSTAITPPPPPPLQQHCEATVEGAAAAAATAAVGSDWRRPPAFGAMDAAAGLCCSASLSQPYGSSSGGGGSGSGLATGITGTATLETALEEVVSGSSIWETLRATTAFEATEAQAVAVAPQPSPSPPRALPLQNGHQSLKKVLPAAAAAAPLSPPQLQSQTSLPAESGVAAPLLRCIEPEVALTPVTAVTPLRPDVQLGATVAVSEVKLLPLMLGKGAFGRVMAGQYGGKCVAVKLLNTGLMGMGVAMGPGGEAVAAPAPAAAAVEGAKGHVAAAAAMGAEAVAAPAVGAAAAVHAPPDAAAPPAAHRFSRDSSAWRALAQEVEVLARCKHPNIVRLLAASLMPPRVCLVMELMDTSLDRLLHAGVIFQKGPKVHVKEGREDGATGVETAEVKAAAKGESTPLPLHTVLHIGIQIARALAYLHPTILHRDLKPANVLISRPDSDTPVAKLADFGLSRLRDTVLITKNPEVGTVPYMAPEAFDVSNCIITDRVDIYALGVILWEMLTGKRPWAGYAAVQIGYILVALGARLPLQHLPPERCPHKLRSLICSCWEADPARRPAAAEVVKALVLVQEALRSPTFTLQGAASASSGAARLMRMNS